MNIFNQFSSKSMVLRSTGAYDQESLMRVEWSEIQVAGHLESISPMILIRLLIAPPCLDLHGVKRQLWGGDFGLSGWHEGRYGMRD